MIDLLPEQRNIADKGGTMRLGLYPIAPDRGHARPRGSTGRGSSRSATATATRSTTTTSRGSRSTGCGISGIWAEKQLVEIIELPDHPCFVAGQFHPEFRSRPWEPHPLFAGFVKAALDHAGRAPRDARRARSAIGPASRSAAARRWRSSAARARSRARSTR